MSEEHKNCSHNDHDSSGCDHSGSDHTEKAPSWAHCGISLLSCQEYSKLASKKLDEPLTTWEHITYSVHKFICMVCRRYERQIKAINSAAKAYAQKLSTDDSLEMSDAAKNRMKSEISKELQNS